MDWFQELTGFRELDYTKTRQQLEVVGDRLRSKVNGRSYGIGELELVSLNDLRERVCDGPALPGSLKVSLVRGDVRSMHSEPENADALFQVASQFNLLEMVSQNVTPEHGVTRYQNDGTQGPACAVAAGAATIFRNYFADVDGHSGQTSERQLDGLADLGKVLGNELGQPVEALWNMRNGYALCTRDGLIAISDYLSTLSSEQLNLLRGNLRIGLHSAVQVTDLPEDKSQFVSQAFCSALPVAYSPVQVPSEHWQPFATLVLESAYEATLLAAVLNAQRNSSNILMLTRLGGGAFDNDPEWIDSAMRRALRLAADYDLDVRLVSYGPPSHEILQLAEDFG